MWCVIVAVGRTTNVAFPVALIRLIFHKPTNNFTIKMLVGDTEDVIRAVETSIRQTHRR